MRRCYRSPYIEVIDFQEADIITTSGLEDIGQEGGSGNNGPVDDSGDFEW